MRNYDCGPTLIQHMRGYRETLRLAAVAGQITKPTLGHGRRGVETLDRLFAVFAGFMAGLIVASIILTWF